MTEAELRKQDNRKLTNVIRELPGVTMTIQGGDCEINIYIDGVAVSDNDLEKLSVNEFAALEFYSGGATIPVQYIRTGASYGAILLWTRER
jgi:hypothetical protein